MKKFSIWIIMCVFLIMSASCAYESAYRDYAVAQKEMAVAAGPLVRLHPDGRLAELGNPLVAMAMMQMKAPRSEVESFFEWLKYATPFGFMWGVTAGAFDAVKSTSGHNTTVQGSNNFLQNSAGNQSPSQWQSPTTTTVTEMVAPPVE